MGKGGKEGLFLRRPLRAHRPLSLALSLVRLDGGAPAQPVLAPPTR